MPDVRWRGPEKQKDPAPRARHFLLLGLDLPLAWEILAVARKEGHRVSAVWPGPQPPAPVGDQAIPELISGDPGRPELWAERLTGVDAILDLTGPIGLQRRRQPRAAGQHWQASLGALLSVAKTAGVHRVVLMGDARWFPNLEGSRPAALAPHAFGYGRAVVPVWGQVRTLCRESGLAVRVHPGWIYGRDLWFSTEVINALKYQGRAWMVGSGENWIAPIHSRDVASGLLLAAEHGNCDQDYLLTSEPVRWADFLGMTARYMGIQTAPRRVPAWWVALRRGRMAVESLITSCLPHTDRAAKELGWQLKYPLVHDGLPLALKDLGVLAWK